MPGAWRGSPHCQTCGPGLESRRLEGPPLPSTLGTTSSCERGLMIHTVLLNTSPGVGPLRQDPPLVGVNQVALGTRPAEPPLQMGIICPRLGSWMRVPGSPSEHTLGWGQCGGQAVRPAPLQALVPRRHSACARWGDPDPPEAGLHPSDHRLPQENVGAVRPWGTPPSSPLTTALQAESRGWRTEGQEVVRAESTRGGGTHTLV